MDKVIKQQIISDIQIKKFSAYGFLKNLAFFKPYLIIFLLSKGVNLFEIGILYSIREITIYIFEIPSGIIADYYGRKKELYMCFIFYIISFVLFFIMDSFYIAIVAMIIFGLGEAFRSGTHKAMILSYLENKGLKDYKAFVYGRTRSFSLIGSAINAILSIILILWLPSYNFIFLVSIFPYIADFILIYTYPISLDKEDGVKNKAKNVKRNILNDLVYSFKKADLRLIILDQGIFQSIIKSTKDMIQPVLQSLVLSVGIIFISSSNTETSYKVVIGIAYFIINIISSYFSKNAYRIKMYFNSVKIMNISFIVLGLTLISTAIAIEYESIVFSFLLFLVINVISNIRKPIYVDLLDSHMDKNLRATVISVESQITAMLTMIIAPVFGYIAHKFSIKSALFIIGVVIFIISLIISKKRIEGLID